jgi:hypothetical protein
MNVKINLKWTELPNGDIYGVHKGMSHYYLQREGKSESFYVSRIYPAPEELLDNKAFEIEKAKKLAAEDFKGSIDAVNN